MAGVLRRRRGGTGAWGCMRSPTSSWPSRGPIVRSGIQRLCRSALARVGWPAPGLCLRLVRRLLRRLRPGCLRQGHVARGRDVDHRRGAAPGRERVSARDMRIPGYMRIIVPRGEQHSRHKLTETEVWEIRALLAQGETQRAVGSLFGMSRQGIGDIACGRNWGWLKDVPDPQILRLIPRGTARGEGCGGSKLTEHQVREIRTRIAGGESNRAVARAYCVAHSTVSHIISGRIWGWLADE